MAPDRPNPVLSPADGGGDRWWSLGGAAKPHPSLSGQRARPVPDAAVNIGLQQHPGNPAAERLVRIDLPAWPLAVWINPIPKLIVARQLL